VSTPYAACQLAPAQALQRQTSECPFAPKGGTEIRTRSDALANLWATWLSIAPSASCWCSGWCWYWCPGLGTGSRGAPPIRWKSAGVGSEPCVLNRIGLRPLPLVIGCEPVRATWRLFRGSCGWCTATAAHGARSGLVSPHVHAAHHWYPKCRQPPPRGP